MRIISDNIDKLYMQMCDALLTANEVNGTKELLNTTVVLTDITNNIVTIRDISIPYLFGELLWYFNGSNSTEFISKFSKMWEKLSDDGVTSNSAYGYLMMHKHGFNQIEKIIELLKCDPNSRRAVINLNVPNVNVIETNDEPCTIALQFLIRDGKLNCTTMMRSNDIWLGFPYDITFFTELQKYIADALGIGYGTYTHFVTSLHVYYRNICAVKEIVREKPESKKIKFNHELFHTNKQLFFKLIAHSENPKVDVVELFKRYGVFEEE